jgi:quercetin dioxygenase-like cupin family protein
MLMRRAEEMDGEPMDMEGVKDVSRRVLVGRGDGAETFAMRHVTIEPGGHTPRHSHNYEHEIYILQGVGRVEHEGEFHEIRTGDSLFIEPNRIHQFSNPGPSPLKFLCLVPMQFDCADEGMQPVPGT